MGQVQAHTGSFAGGSLVMAVALCLGGGLVLLVRHDAPEKVAPQGENVRPRSDSEHSCERRDRPIG